MTIDAKRLAAGIAESVRQWVEPAFKNVLTRLDKNSQMLESVEKRLSRHADHLSEVQSRLQALERGKK